MSLGIRNMQNNSQIDHQEILRKSKQENYYKYDIKNMFCIHPDCKSNPIAYKKIKFRNYNGYTVDITIAWCKDHNVNPEQYAITIN